MGEEDLRQLKQFVKQHPDNKMAWYLLGREYAAKGEEGKANYCYAQAGEVFEAYEQIPMNIKLPERMPGTDSASSLEAAVQSASGSASTRSKPALMERGRGESAYRKARVIRLAGTALIGLAVLLFVPSASVHHAPDRLSEGETAKKESPATNQGGSTQAFAPAGTRGAIPELDVFAVFGAYTAQEVKATAKELLLPVQPAAKTAVVTAPAMSADGKWVLWAKPPEVLMAAERGADGARLDVRYYKGALCGCAPEDASRPSAMLAAWQEQQEQLLLLSSAAAAYARLNGTPPAALERLAQPYPDNTLSGYTPLMRDAWPRLAAGGAEAVPAGTVPGSASEAPAGGQAQSASGPAGGKPSAAWKLTEPLEIVVDKAAHRLALVSGNVVLRNYPVGLGGPKTPTGEFAVTEKVKHPNGHDDGEFGSRGMTLSDTLYAIHGTNKPKSIGRDESHGCIRMLKEDVEELFDYTPKGTKVTIVASGALPEEIVRAAKPFHLPAMAEESNPNKTYKWLD